MSSKYNYQGKLISLSDAVSKIQSGDRIGLAIAASEPCGLLTELAKQKDRLEDVHTWVCLPMRAYDYAINPEMEKHFYL